MNESERREWPLEVKLWLFQRQGGYCGRFPHGCAERLVRPDDDDEGRCPVELDHIIPLGLGGADDPDNLQILHKACHAQKSRKEAGDFAALRREGTDS